MMKYPLKECSKKGFSLVQVLISAGLIAGLALIIAQLGKQSFSVQSTTQSNADLVDFQTEIGLILRHSKDCTASLRGIEFQGSSINTTPVQVELWTSDQDGNRVNRKVRSGDAFGKLKITDVSLSMPDYTGTTNFPAGSSNFKATLSLKGSYQRLGKIQAFPEIKRTLSLGLTTNASGVSTITSCNQESSGSSLERLAIYQTSCIWTGDGSAPECNPPSCQSDDIDKGVGCDRTYQLWGGPAGYSGGNCFRTCLSKLDEPMFLYHQQCRSQSCTPAACASEEIDKGVICILHGSDMGGPSGTSYGTCKRQCFAKSPF